MLKGNQEILIRHLLRLFTAGIFLPANADWVIAVLFIEQKSLFLPFFIPAYFS